MTYWTIPEYVKRIEIVTLLETVKFALRNRNIIERWKYEDAIAEALKRLKFGTLIQYGHKKKAQRYMDLVWEVPIIDSVTNSKRALLIVMEAKSGEAIKQLDERILIDQAKNTVKVYRGKLYKFVDFGFGY